MTTESELGTDVPVEGRSVSSDKDFETVTIAEVRQESDAGWQITRDDGWSFFVPATSPVTPEVGMTAKFFGKGIGSTVRGLVLDGQTVFYRTEAEDKEHHEISMYGADAKDWLQRWDDGKTVWSIEMGGLGPGYEQCIHITTAEVLRFWFAEGYEADKFNDADYAQKVQDATQRALFKCDAVTKLGLSGAQYGAAVHLAGQLFRKGPRGVMSDEAMKDRHIQVSRVFPH